MQVRLEPVKRRKKPILANLLEKYEYEFSEYNGRDVGPEGLFGYGKDFGYDALDAYWERIGFYPFFIRADGKLAGFVMVNDIPELPASMGVLRGTDYTMAEFFVMVKYRRRGVGREAAFAAFDKYPGRWQLKRHPKNTASVHFWDRVVAEYTGGKFVLFEAQPDTEYEDGTSGDVFCFHSQKRG